MDPLVAGGERRLVVADRGQSLRGGHRRWRLHRRIEVVEIQRGAQAHFVFDYFFDVTLDRCESVQRDVQIVVHVV